MTVPVPPTGPTSDDKTWGMFAWLGALIVNFVGCGLGFLAPLIIMLTKGKDSQFVRANAVESLNVFITVAIGVAAGFAFWFITAILGALLPLVISVLITLFGVLVWLVALGAGIYGLVIAIMGSVAANKGEQYKAPFAFRFVK
ncbi:MAG: DUF4870 domain-containing protein [Acidimicrobiia bacterium]